MSNVTYAVIQSKNEGNLYKCILGRWNFHIKQDFEMAVTQKKRQYHVSLSNLSTDVKQLRNFVVCVSHLLADWACKTFVDVLLNKLLKYL